MSHHDGGVCRGKRWSELSVNARVGMIVAGIVLVPLLFGLCSGTTMWLWNWLMPGIFKLPPIGFWQAAGILLLSQILFKGRHFAWSGRSQSRRARIENRIENKESVEVKA